jgi:hypothetical protein
MSQSPEHIRKLQDRVENNINLILGIMKENPGITLNEIYRKSQETPGFSVVSRTMINRYIAIGIDDMICSWYSSITKFPGAAYHHWKVNRK